MYWLVNIGSAESTYTAKPNSKKSTPTTKEISLHQKSIDLQLHLIVTTIIIHTDLEIYWRQLNLSGRFLCSVAGVSDSGLFS